MDTSERLLREPAVLDIIGRGRTYLWAAVRAGCIPAPVRVGAKAVAWPRSEITTIVSARIAGLTDDQIRALVLRLEARRRALADELLANEATSA